MEHANGLRLRTALDAAAAIVEQQGDALGVQHRVRRPAELPWFGTRPPRRLEAAETGELRARAAELESWVQGPFRVAEDLVLGGRWRDDSRWEAIGDHIGDLSGARVLDVGSNAGYDPFVFRARGAREVTACEPRESIEQMRFLEAIYASGIDPRQTGWQQLSAEEHGRYDLVHCNGVLHREPSPLGLLARLREMVADGGRLLLGTVVLESGDLAEHARFVPNGFAGDPTWWWVPGRAAMRWMLESAGFRVEILRDTFSRGPEGSFPVLDGYYDCVPAEPDGRLGAVASDHTTPSRSRSKTMPAGRVELPTCWPRTTEFDPRAASDALIAFVEALPYERRSIAGFVQAIAKAVPAGTRVLDLGAGDAPFSELFAHTDYVTNDVNGSPHGLAGPVDVVASADALPLPDGSFDLVLTTQVLEHVADPSGVLAETARVLRPGGALHLTVPLVWEMHELPYDYRRFTTVGLQALLEDAGFVEVTVRPRNDAFTTLAQLMLNATAMVSRDVAGPDAHDRAVGLLERLSDTIAALAPLDQTWTMPLGLAASARRPG
jgi:SAM-dependent methyltransferase